MSIIHVDDLPDSLQSAEMVGVLVAGANARALRVAPCLADDPSEPLLDEARLILIGAVKRWCEAGSGALQQQAAGPFSVTTDTRQRTGYNLWPSEISALVDLCRGESSGAFAVDTVSRAGGAHADVCSLVFGGGYCSCGSDVNGGEWPLWGAE